MSRAENVERLLLNDCYVARLLGFSRSWMRQQRHRRKNGLNHQFDLDPIWIGTSPRYELADVERWIESKRNAPRGGDAE